MLAAQYFFRLTTLDFAVLILLTSCVLFNFVHNHNMDRVTTASLQLQHLHGGDYFNATEDRSIYINNDTSEINNNNCNFVGYSNNNISTTFDSANQRLRLLIVSATNWFIARIHNQPFPDHLLSNDDLQDANRMLHSVRNHYKEWLSFERGFVIVALVCCVTTVLFTLFYTVYSCCCCACKSNKNGGPGRRGKRAHTEQYGSWKRFCSNSLLCLIIAISSLLLTIAFLCNQYLSRSICAGGKTLIKSVDDFGVYQNETNAALEKLLIRDYSSATRVLRTKLDDASDHFVSFTFQSLNSTLLENFSNFALDLDNTNYFVKNVHSIALNVESELRLLESNLTGTLQIFSSDLSDCLNSENDEEKQDCAKAKQLVDQYAGVVHRAVDNAIRSIIEYKTLVESLLHSLNVSSINNSINEQLESFRSDLSAKLQQQRSGIEEVLEKVAESLNNTWTNLTKNLNFDALSPLKGHIAKHDAVISNHEYYRWLTIILICSFCAFILACLFIGLLFSSCGSRPRFLGNGCCSSSKSTYYFSSAIFFGVFCLSAFMVITCLMFIVGGNSRAMLCQDFSDMDGDRSPLFKILERYWEIYKGNFAERRDDRDAGTDFGLLSDYNLSTILSGCREGKTFYSIFDFDTRLNVNETLDVHGQIEKSSERYINKLKSLELNFGFVESFQHACKTYSAEVKQALDSEYLSSDFLAEFKNNITAFNFDQDLRLVEDAANALTFPLPKRHLSTLFIRLDELNTKNVHHIRQHSLDLNSALQSLSSQQLTQLKVSVDKILTAKSSSVVKALNGKIVKFSEQLAGDLLGNFTTQAHNYTRNVRNELETRVTSCLPVRKIVVDLGETICEEIVDPFNSLWMCVGIVLLFFIPAILLASSLKKLYFNAICYDADSSGSNDSHRCIVDAYSTVTDDYGCYRRCSDSSYNDPVGRNHNVQHLKYPVDRQYYSEVDSYLPPPYYSRR